MKYLLLVLIVLLCHGLAWADDPAPPPPPVMEAPCETKRAQLEAYGRVLDNSRGQVEAQLAMALAEVDRLKQEIVKVREAAHKAKRDAEAKK